MSSPYMKTLRVSARAHRRMRDAADRLGITVAELVRRACADILQPDVQPK